MVFSQFSPTFVGMSKYVSIFFCFMLLCWGAKGQVMDVQGVVIDAQTQEAIPDVFIGINWTKKGYSTLADGSFFISVQLQDTLTFRVLGYESKPIVITEAMGQERLEISLTQASIEIEEVTITNWGDYGQFREKILNMSPDSVLPLPQFYYDAFGHKESNPIAPAYRPFAGKPTVLSTVFNPMNTINYFSKREKMLRKLSGEMLHQYNVAQYVDSYNEEIIANTLGLKGEELLNFKRWCDSRIELNGKSEIEIISQIKTLYEEYQNREE